ncbi:hypothetical protein PXK58_09070 [Phaeobacter gallaeciensis]|uniref:hypothetical protein n=1 Tax=Phaeobacter gallaeciensis TaxID=60890 RepID=UPI00237FFD0D|nr:hypothetical protein [Phaeobacter gallaeciensis]MDE4274723.1 hypothetical protein [Phaeobacter gallaeciensis]MDE4299703.1 hypothetical protein [Phaeobacter gallaeciensis]MDE5184868.1 hypothetical protein [Phaeobacter gallaeciensis]
MTPPTTGTSREERFFIRKNGVYYRPNSRGYTTSAISAGLYTQEEAEKITHPNGQDGPRDGMSYIAEHICPDEDWKAYRAVCAEREALRDQLAAAKGLPWRAKDIKRGLILFRTSSNAHGSINYQARSEKVDNLPQSAKDELAAIMVNMALGYSLEEVAANGVVKEWVAAARNEALEEAAKELIDHANGDFEDQNGERAWCVSDDFIFALKDALKSTTPAPREDWQEHADKASAIIRGSAEREVTVQEAYLAGFMAAGEGYNGEYPFQDENASPESCDMWVNQRDEDLRALANEEKSDG